MPKVLIRYIKFMGTSVVGTIVDTLVLWVLSDLVFTQGYWGEYIISPVLSFQCAVSANFLISYFYVWKDRTRGSSSDSRAVTCPDGSDAPEVSSGDREAEGTDWASAPEVGESTDCPDSVGGLAPLSGSRHSTARFFRLFLAYNLSGSLVFLLRLAVLLLIENFTGWDVVICNLLAMCFSGLLNFAINNLLIFRARKA